MNVLGSVSLSRDPVHWKLSNPSMKVIMATPAACSSQPGEQARSCSHAPLGRTFNRGRYWWDNAVIEKLVSAGLPPGGRTHSSITVSEKTVGSQTSPSGV